MVKGNGILPERQAWRLEAAGLSCRGRVRKNNEDAFVICDELGLYLVSDGMGGFEGGEVVSALTARALPLHLRRILKEKPPAGEFDMVELLAKALISLNNEFLAYTAQKPDLNRAGATVVACWFWGRWAALAYMGDSRIYRLRKGHLESLTRDHTVVNLLLEMNKILIEEAQSHPGNDILTRYVGMKPEALPETDFLEVEAGDCVLLCSDGLWGTIPDKTIAEIMESSADPARICRRLIAAANDAGGPDNITALVVQIKSSATG